jgi:hypothetical protein
MDREQNKTPFARKIKEIEQEKRRIQREIKALARAMKRGEMPPAPGRTTAAHGAGSGEAGEADLFSWSASASAVQDGAARDTVRKTGGPLGRGAPVRGDQRFANYFSTGGFKSPLPAPKDRSVQRNKRIFLAVVGVLLVYILIHIFFL